MTGERCLPGCGHIDKTTSKEITMDIDASAHYSGEAGCPECGGGDGRVINVGPAQVAFCSKHRVKWVIGSNLFSSWRNQTEDEQRRIYDELGLGDFEHVDERVDGPVA
jgi:hypothetical protein